jgi:hypothetical protein
MNSFILSRASKRGDSDTLAMPAIKFLLQMQHDAACAETLL